MIEGAARVGLGKAQSRSNHVVALALTGDWFALLPWYHSRRLSVTPDLDGLRGSEACGNSPARTQCDPRGSPSRACAADKQSAAAIHPHLTGCDTGEPRATSFSEAGGSALTMPGVAQLADVGMNETIAVGPHAPTCGSVRSTLLRSGLGPASA
jgi:hypothetical protein